MLIHFGDSLERASLHLNMVRRLINQTLFDGMKVCMKEQSVTIHYRMSN